MLLRIMACVPLLLALDGAQTGTTVRRASGETVQGTIEGLIVLKGEPATRTRGGRTEHTVRYAFIEGRHVASIDERGVRADPDGYMLVWITRTGAPVPDSLALAQLRSASPRGGWRPSAVSIRQNPRASAIIVAAPLRVTGSGAGARVGLDFGEFTADDALRITRDFHDEAAASVLSHAISEQPAIAARFRAEAAAGGSAMLAWSDRLLGEADPNTVRMLPRIKLGTERGVLNIPVTDVVRFRRASRP